MTGADFIVWDSTSSHTQVRGANNDDAYMWVWLRFWPLVQACHPLNRQKGWSDDVRCIMPPNTFVSFPSLAATLIALWRDPVCCRIWRRCQRRVLVHLVCNRYLLPILLHRSRSLLIPVLIPFVARIQKRAERISSCLFTLGVSYHRTGDRVLYSWGLVACPASTCLLWSIVGGEWDSCGRRGDRSRFE